MAHSLGLWKSIAMGIGLFLLAISLVGMLARSKHRQPDYEVPSQAHGKHQFDRNALKDVQFSGTSVVALTDSGDLLSVDAGTLILRCERVPSHPFLCVGSGPRGTILAGADDGAVFRIDPETLEYTEIARVRPNITWVGADSSTGGVVVMTRPTDEEEAAESKTQEKNLAGRIHDLASGKVYELRMNLMGHRGRSVTYMDSQRKLWVGFDIGEWGGGTFFVNLATGATGKVKDDSYADNVLGFFEPTPGEVWAYGGLIHFSARWFFARTDRGRAEMVLQTPRERDSEDNLIEPPSDTPRLPITAVLPGGSDGSLLVLSFHELFRLHRPENRWEKVCEFRPRYIQGRPDAMGSYPGIVRAVHVKSDPLDLILATRLDGLLRYSKGTVSHHTLSIPIQGSDPRR